MIPPLLPTHGPSHIPLGTLSSWGGSHPSNALSINMHIETLPHAVFSLR